MISFIKFITCTKEEFEALSEKDENALYFVNYEIGDTSYGKIYKGSVLFASTLINDLNQDEIIAIDGGKAPENV